MKRFVKMNEEVIEIFFFYGMNYSIGVSILVNFFFIVRSIIVIEIILGE